MNIEKHLQAIREQYPKALYVEISTQAAGGKWAENLAAGYWRTWDAAEIKSVSNFGAGTLAEFRQYIAANKNLCKIIKL